MNCRDSAGDSLLHYVASCMEEDAIFRVMSSGANIMCRWTGGSAGYMQHQEQDLRIQRWRAGV